MSSFTPEALRRIKARTHDKLCVSQKKRWDEVRRLGFYRRRLKSSEPTKTP